MAACRSRSYDFIVDFDGRPGQANVDALLNAMRQACPSVAVNQAKVVPWFPTRIGDIDAFSSKTLDAGAELESDHPGFSDEGYRARRRAIVEAASTYRHGMSIPRVDYTKEEVATWGAVYAKLGTYTRQFAVEQYNTILPLLEKVRPTRGGSGLRSDVHRTGLILAQPHLAVAASSRTASRRLPPAAELRLQPHQHPAAAGHQRLPQVRHG